MSRKTLFFWFSAQLNNVHHILDLLAIAKSKISPNHHIWCNRPDRTSTGCVALCSSTAPKWKNRLFFREKNSRKMGVGCCEVLWNGAMWGMIPYISQPMWGMMRGLHRILWAYDWCQKPPCHPVGHSQAAYCSGESSSVGRWGWRYGCIVCNTGS